jgi:putative flippase GtrA
MRTLRELASFGAIGIAGNATLYALYLALTAFGIGPKMAMSAAFLLGVLCTYGLNRRWTFRHDGAMGHSATRYALAYLFAYAMNIAALALLVDVARLPHRVVMLALIFATASLMFALQKFWVFPLRPVASSTDSLR